MWPCNKIWLNVPTRKSASYSNCTKLLASRHYSTNNLKDWNRGIHAEIFTFTPRSCALFSSMKKMKTLIHQIATGLAEIFLFSPESNCCQSSSSARVLFIINNHVASLRIILFKCGESKSAKKNFNFLKSFQCP